jgi:hypothetical protein
MNTKKNKSGTKKNFSQQGVDKFPGEEEGKNEPVKPADLKGKKVDADPGRTRDKPVRQDVN